MKFIDITGKRFGKLTVLRLDYVRNKKHYWLCRCDCGKTKTIEGMQIKSGRTSSCGCLRSQMSKERKLTHGLSGTPLFEEWCRIKRRCYNKNMACYKNYGGRGISVCDEWLNNAEAFVSWSLANGYQKGLSLDRIDNNKGYSPDNCRWTTRKVQANNTRHNHYITYKNETHTLAEWSEKLQMNYSVLKYRVNHGWSIEKAFLTPIEKKYSHKRG